MTNMTPASPTPVSKPKPRPRPQVMKLTEAAARRIAELTERADSEIVGLRVGIKNGGCAGQSYTVEYAHDLGIGALSQFGNPPGGSFRQLHHLRAGPRLGLRDGCRGSGCHVRHLFSPRSIKCRHFRAKPDPAPRALHHI